MEPPDRIIISQGGLYGGFFSVEFARNDEVQTELYTTTQESVTHYFARDWNTDAVTLISAVLLAS